MTFNSFAIVLAIFLIVRSASSDSVIKPKSGDISCDGSSNEKFSNIRTSFSLTNYCKYTIKPFAPGVCQLRVDFTINLPQPSNQLNPPGLLPACTENYVKIGSNKFCGINVNQHVYLPFGSSADETIEVVRGLGYATWHIKVTQLECPPIKNPIRKLIEDEKINFEEGVPPNWYSDAEFIAPNGCLQYYTEPSGRFQSFNYNMGNGPYLPNMRYAICFRRSQRARAIQFSTSVFRLSHHHDLGKTNEMCYDDNTPGYSNDYLFVPFSRIVGGDITGTHYCGDVLEETKLESTMPGSFAIVFNSGDVIMGEGQGQPAPHPRAFSISYNIVN